MGCGTAAGQCETHGQGGRHTGYGGAGGGGARLSMSVVKPGMHQVDTVSQLHGQGGLGGWIAREQGTNTARAAKNAATM